MASRQNSENQMNQNEIREYAMNLPTRGKIFYYLNDLIISKRIGEQCKQKN